MPTATRPVPTTLLNVTGFYRLTVEQYRKVIDAGVFVESEPVELFGATWWKGMRNPPHKMSLRRLTVRVSIARLPAVRAALGEK